ncbi:MAG TPA: hypothetical protein VGI84_03690 [Pseudonocardiaceae bacterium]
MTRAHIPAQAPAPRNREFLGRRPDQRRAAPPHATSPLWDNTRLAVLAFTRQVLLRPVRIGTLVGLGGMIALVAVRGDSWWIVLGVLLFQATAAAFTAMWVDVESVAVASSHAAAPMPAQLDWPQFFVPQQRRPRSDQ